MKKLLLSIALITSANACMAEEGPNWNYVGLSYEVVQDPIHNLKGAGLAGSVLLGGGIFMTGGYISSRDDSNVDVGGTDQGGNWVTYIEKETLDLNFHSLGLGYRHAVSERSDFFGVVGYKKTDIKFSINQYKFEYPREDFSLDVGVKSLITPKIELTASMGHLLDESEFTSNVSAMYRINNRFGVSIGHTTRDDIHTLSLTGLLLF